MKLKVANLFALSLFVPSSLAFAEHIYEGKCGSIHDEQDSKDQLEIFTIQKFREIDPHLNALAEKTDRQKIHLVFDIDNTILTPNTDIADAEQAKVAERATDGFYYKQKNTYLAQFKETNADNAKQLAYQTAVNEWNDVVIGTFGEVPYKLVDADFVTWLNEKHSEGHPSMAHTAREPSLELATVKQLASFGIDFSKHSPLQGHMEISTHDPEPALFQNGIYIVGRGGISALHHKGNRYNDLIDVLTKPDQRDFIVVFVDDRMEHVVGMVKMLKKRGIRCVGFYISTISAETEHK